MKETQLSCKKTCCNKNLNKVWGVVFCDNKKNVPANLIGIFCSKERAEKALVQQLEREYEDNGNAQAEYLAKLRDCYKVVEIPAEEKINLNLLHLRS